MPDVLHSLTDDGLAGGTYGPVIGAVTLLLRACEEDGSIRPGVAPDDVLLMLGFLWRVSPGEEGEARAARMLDPVVDVCASGVPRRRTPRCQRQGLRS